MRAAASLLILVACNEVYGLEPTTRRDAAYFDAGIDAPHQCPPIGTPPRFSRRFRQVLAQACFDFAVARSGKTLATCGNEANTGLVISEGTLTQPMTRAPGFQVAGKSVASPRLAPDGMTALTRLGDESGTITFGEFVRGDAGWTLRSEVVVPGGYTSTSTTANRHLLVVTADGVQELVDDGNGFVPRMLHGSLGVALFSDRLSVTADGLHLLLFALRTGEIDYQLLYADRATDSAPFSPVTPLPDLDYLSDGYMTEDCAHLYFSGLGLVFATQPD